MKKWKLAVLLVIVISIIGVVLNYTVVSRDLTAAECNQLWESWLATRDAEVMQRMVDANCGQVTK